MKGGSLDKQHVCDAGPRPRGLSGGYTQHYTLSFHCTIPFWCHKNLPVLQPLSMSILLCFAVPVLRPWVGRRREHDKFDGCPQGVNAHTMGERWVTLYDTV